MLIRAITGMAEGQTYVDPAVAEKLFNHITGTTVSLNTSLANPLSARERESLRLLADGLSNADIAKELFLSKGQCIIMSAAGSSNWV